MATSGSDLIHVNVGGVEYTTTRATLTRDPDSILAEMAESDPPTDDESYFIDRDGSLFRYVLNFLRSSQLNLPEGFKEMAQLKAEALFYKIRTLAEELDERENILLGHPKTGALIEIHEFGGRKLAGLAGPSAGDAPKPCFSSGEIFDIEGGAFFLPPLNKFTPREGKYIRWGADIQSQFGSKGALCVMLKSYGWEKIHSMSCPEISAGTTVGIRIVEKWHMRIEK